MNQGVELVSLCNAGSEVSLLSAKDKGHGDSCDYYRTQIVWMCD